ncbi:chemotaxis protein CheX [Thermoclostridium stercorarium]|jgi:chemotaxis protein CheX|uniref:chemotaxis protein CheX n=1 Tax=Thermoclostridium stercorarium TaxID=1510 RepID=UPI0004BB93D2|nr:chemotaxis protein CheX [Thermoclostridium stercorarium]UZQ85059.1 chemotaxis protein CheX [Thermoclostridium stercorarium]
MKVEYINPFIEASQQVFQMVIGVKPSLKKVYLKKSPYNSDSVAVIVGLTGTIRGQVIISLSVETAKIIASTMMGGMPIEVFDDMARSAIAELGNMIIGNTATILSTRGINVEITPPSLLMGDNIVVSQIKMNTICVPLDLGDSRSVDIDVSIEE